MVPLASTKVHIAWHSASCAVQLSLVQESLNEPILLWEGISYIVESGMKHPHIFSRST